MSDAAADTITLTEHHYTDIRSTSADVLVKVSETSLGARSSLRVAGLRGRLAERGFAEGEVMLQGVDLTPWAWIAIPFIFIVPIAIVIGGGALQPGLVAGGTFVFLYLLLRAAKLGSVTATLKVHCAGAARVSIVIDEALSFGAEVASIGWRYDIEETSQVDWAVKCVERANGRAARLAAALGVGVLGVHEYHEEQVLPQTAYTAPAAAQMAVASHRKARLGHVSESLGESPSNSDRAGLRVTIAYRVGDQAARS
jgi:hypothetical protein